MTVADLNFTWRTYVNPQNEVASRSGWDSIRRIVAVNSKTARIIFAKPYAGWKALMVNSWYPSHALTGANFNEVWNNNYNHPRSGVSMASGPMRLTSYTRGQTLVISRNPTFWGKRPSLDSIVFRFIPETTRRSRRSAAARSTRSIRSRSSSSRADPEPAVEIQSGAGTTWEHIDFQYASGHALEEEYVRKAIAEGIDRQATIASCSRTSTPTSSR